MRRRHYELTITCVAILLGLVIEPKGTLLVVASMLTICILLMAGCVLLEYTNEPKGKRNMVAATKKTIHEFLHEA